MAAALDAIVTAIPNVPFTSFSLAGAWKLPLSLVWVFWLAVDLLRPPNGPALTPLGAGGRG